MAKVRIHARVNGERIERLIEPATRLIDLLRDDLNLTATPEGCGLGRCGGCVVLVNQRPVHACQRLAIQIDGADITTIEGVSAPPLHPIQHELQRLHPNLASAITPGLILFLIQLTHDVDQIENHDLDARLDGFLDPSVRRQPLIDAVRHALDNLRKTRPEQSKPDERNSDG